MRHHSTWLWITVIAATMSMLMALPRFTINIDQKIGSIPIKINQTVGGYNIDFHLLGFQFKRELKFQPGLDLQGGVHVVLEADMSGIEPGSEDEALSSVKQVIERRINFLGVVEPNIYTSVSSGKQRIVVELPGVTDTAQVVGTIGETAQLDFREEFPPEDQPNVAPADQKQWRPTDLTGKFLKRAQVVYEPSTGQPAVQIVFNDEGAKLFEEVTRRNIDKRLAIFLDERPITAPTVQQAIVGGEATITGQFTVDEARNLVVQLNAGALPVPVSIVQQQNIGPSLGQETIQKSIIAGLVGLGLVALFMLINYRLLGLFSIFGLIIYGLMTMAIYKFIPVTLTLSGVAGFVLSIGMAVDANILIFERVREELRVGRDVRSAINLGFTRAWDSIRDANTATLITVFVLFNPFDWSFLVTSGTVRGFALTLGIGVLLSLFTGVIITRTLIYQFYPYNRGGSND